MTRARLLTAWDEQRLARRIERGDSDAKDALVTANLRLVYALALRYRRFGVPLEDLVQVGSIGLIKAIDRFQLDRGVDLASFAIPPLTGEIKRHLRDRPRPAVRVDGEVTRVEALLQRALADQRRRRVGVRKEPLPAPIRMV